MTLVLRGKTFHTRFKHLGRLYQKSLKTSNKTEARKREAAYRSDIVRDEFGIADQSKVPTLSQFQERFMAHAKVSVAPDTYQFYVHAWKPLLKSSLAHVQLNRVDSGSAEQFARWRLAQGVSRTTVNHNLRTLRRALGLAYEWNLIKRIPKVRLLTGENQREATIDEATLEKMVDALKTMYPMNLMYYLLPFLVDTGLRISEALNLRLEDVSLPDTEITLQGTGSQIDPEARGSVRVRKGKSKYARREVPLTLRAMNCVREAMSRSKCEYVWVEKRGYRAMSRNRCTKLFKQAKMAIDPAGEFEGMVLHSTRHTFCTRLGERGADAYAIQKLAGHSSILISQRYVHAGQDTAKKAIALLENASGAGAGK
jgi:integrase